jgi:diguanylate cyclase (GGDEF)-like protein
VNPVRPEPRRRNWWQRLRIPAIALAAAAGVIAGAEYVADLELAEDQAQYRNRVMGEAGNLRSRLESEVNATAHLTVGLAVFVATQPHFRDADFERLAEEIVRRGRHVRSIGLARDSVVSHVYPLAGNDAALGLRYMDHPDQRGPVLRMMETGEPIFAGPVALVQGGRGLINRVPVYVANVGPSQFRGRYWGLVSIVLDADSLFAAAGVSPRVEDLRVAVRGADALGAEGELILGEPSVFESGAMLLDIAVPGGTWQIAVVPAAGWNAPAAMGSRQLYRAAGLALGMIMGLLVYGWLIERARIHRMATHDALTGLPNRALAQERLRSMLRGAARHGEGCALMFIDLDDFKPINDRFGHRAGDAALRQIARRVRGELRGSDTFARVGGDEFLLVLPNVRRHEEARRVADKVIEMISVPLQFRGANLKVGGSAGYALFPEHGTTAEALWVAADGAMYAAKMAGKGQVRSAPPSLSSVPEPQAAVGQTA